jgi:hypothetical protein
MLLSRSTSPHVNARISPNRRPAYPASASAALHRSDVAVSISVFIVVLSSTAIFFLLRCFGRSDAASPSIGERITTPRLTAISNDPRNSR